MRTASSKLTVWQIPPPRDADRVAQYNAAHKTLGEKQQRREEVERPQTQTALDLQQAQAEWLVLWSHVTASPSTPGEMSSWIDAIKLLLEQRDPLLADEAELAALEPQILRRSRELTRYVVHYILAGHPQTWMVVAFMRLGTVHK